MTVMEEAKYRYCNPANIPPELTELKQWVVWGVDKNNPKCPYNPDTMKPAKAGDASTWSYYKHALVRVRDRQALGIGFEFNGSGIYGVDLDNVLIDGQLTPEAQEIIESLNSYTELSPSGKGLHILIRANGVELEANRKGFIEIYNKERYFTITGNVFGETRPIREGTAELQAVYDKYLKPKPPEPKRDKPTTDYPASDSFLNIGLQKDGSLISLWNGSRPNGNESADDMALINKLAYWCNGDEGLITRAFYDSPHYSGKDDKYVKKCNRPDYISRTITKAVSGLNTTASEDNRRYRAEQAKKDFSSPAHPTPTDTEPKPLGSGAEEKKKTPTQAETILQLVDATGADFFHSNIGDLFAAIPISEHIEVWPLEGKAFKTWLYGLYYKDTGKAANNEAVGQVVSVLSAKARFDRPEPVTLHTRAAERNGVIWYDLTNDKWQAVKVTAAGWEVADKPPIIFCRYRHQTAQVMPHPGGDIRKVLKYINLRQNDTLFLCWLVSCFIPHIPHVILILFGEKGAAKSTACEFLKAIIDPSGLATLTLTNDPRSMAVSLQQHYFLPFDNVSHISEEISDTLCRASTGGGMQLRKLFTDADDTIFTFKRNIALNGINNVATRADLLDRSLLIELERISEENRRELSDIQASFEADRAAILGGILDTLSKAMEIYPTVKLDKLQRMADFTRWGYAIGEALGGLGETFLDEYAANRDNQNTEAINADPVATLVVEFMSEKTEWSGTASELYTELTAIATDNNINIRNKYFPADSARLGKRLNGIKSNLEGVGIAFEKSKKGDNRTLSFYKEKLPSLLSYCPDSLNINGLNPDSKRTVTDGVNSTVRLLSTVEPLKTLDLYSKDSKDSKNPTLTEPVKNIKIEDVFTPIAINDPLAKRCPW